MPAELNTRMMSVRQKGEAVAPSPNKAPNKKLSYQRPRGQFYFSPITPKYPNSSYIPGGGYFVTPFTELDFVNMSTMSNPANYKWTNTVYNTEKKDWEEVTENSVDYSVSYFNNYVAYVAPVLNYSSFAFGDACYRWEGKEYGDFPIYLFPTTNLTDMFNAFGDDMFKGEYVDEVVPVSSKFFGFGSRTQSKDIQSGMIAYVFDKGDGGMGYWFGTDSEYGTMGTRFEKPLQPYVLKGVYIYGRFGTTKNNVEVKFPVKVYQVVKDAYLGLDEEGKQTNFPAELGELIVQGEATMIPGTSDDEPYIGFLECKFYESDGVSTYEVTPEISDEIVVVVEDLNNPDVNFCTLTVSTDEFDEGYGNLGMIGYSSQQNPTEEKPYLLGINNFFRGDPMYTAPSIFIDVERGFIFNAEGDGDSWQAPNEGATKELVLRASTPSEDGMNWEPTLEDGEALPDWLAINMADVYEQDEYTGLVVAEISVEALPADLAGRSAVVKFAYPGASYTYVVNQGDTQGAVEIVGTDAEIVSNKYFDLQGREIKNVPENGVFIQQSTLTDGSVKSVKVVR